MKQPRVEILYFDGCPNHEATRELVERVAAELELGAKPVLVEVPDPDAARAMRFLGSPTVRVDGRDVEPGASDRTDYVFACLPGILPLLVFYALRQTLQAHGRVAPVLWTVLAANLANAAFNWVLVYGKLGFPALGGAGAGWASSVARLFLAVGLLTVGWPVLGPLVRPWRADAFGHCAFELREALGGELSRTIDIGVFGEYHRDHRETLDRLRVDLLQFRRAIEAVLDRLRDQGLYFLSGESWRLGLHYDLWRRELREDIELGALRDDETVRREQQRENDDERAEADGEGNDAAEHAGGSESQSAR